MTMLVGPAAASAPQETTAREAALFDYDASAPLDVQLEPALERDGVQLQSLTYASPRGGRVTATLVRPTAGSGPFAAVLFGHWGFGSRTEFLPEAELLARAGAVSLLVDYPWARPAPWRRAVDQWDKPEQDRDTFAQAVVDLRRGLDLLLARGDVDARRVAYVGHSYGAQWGAILSAVEPRLRAVVLMAGIPDLGSIILDSQDPDIAALRAALPRTQIDAYLAGVAALDAVRWVPRAQAPLLFQFARFERLFDQKAMERYAAAAPAGKTVLWYDTGHELNDVAALKDRLAWLKERIGIGAVRLD
jgi:dienelactone hydrolase